MTDTTVAVIATLDSKTAEARYVCDALVRAGAAPFLIDVSLRPHGESGADVSGAEVAARAGASWDEIAGMSRGDAADRMVTGGTALLADAFRRGAITGAIGLGGANGTSMACALMRGALPPLFPKAVVSAVAGTAAVQWYVAESDIVMFPSIGDVAMNRITRGVLDNAVRAIAAMAKAWTPQAGTATDGRPLIGVSAYGTTAACVARITERLEAAGYEVIHFHASGPGGRALESLAKQGMLAGILDVSTHEVADLVVGGVYSAGDLRLAEGPRAGVPYVFAPGAMDFVNLYKGQVPAAFAGREFVHYNVQNLLMRATADEMAAMGRFVAERLNEATGPLAVLIPKRGFSENTKKTAQDLAGNDTAPWERPAVDAALTEALRRDLRTCKVRELDLHINDPAFADECVDAFLALMPAASADRTETAR